jgi:hypothetical protein
LDITAGFVDESHGAATIVYKFTEQNGAIQATNEAEGAAAQSRSPMS